MKGELSFYIWEGVPIELSTIIGAYSHFDKTSSKALTHRETHWEVGASIVLVSGGERMVEEPTLTLDGISTRYTRKNKGEKGGSK